jgi:hypothetical protein
MQNLLVLLSRHGNKSVDCCPFCHKNKSFMIVETLYLLITMHHETCFTSHLVPIRLIFNVYTHFAWLGWKLAKRLTRNHVPSQCIDAISISISISDINLGIIKGFTHTFNNNNIVNGFNYYIFITSISMVWCTKCVKIKNILHKKYSHIHFHSFWILLKITYNWFGL